LIGKPGTWTLYTSLSFALVGTLVGFFGKFTDNKNFTNLKGRAKLFLITFLMTILWDVITATFFAFEFFIPLEIAMVAQIPFTLLHLSNCLFAFLFAPHLIKFYSELKEFLIFKFLEKSKAYSPLRLE